MILNNYIKFEARDDMVLESGDRVSSFLMHLLFKQIMVLPRKDNFNDRNFSLFELLKLQIWFTS